VVSIALFTDLDGTLTPPERGRGELPREVDEALQELAKLIPVAIVTTKECSLAAARVPYAAAYACINGAEVKAGGYVAVAEDLNPETLAHVAKAAERLDAYVEVKRTTFGSLAGLTIDWRGVGRPPAGLDAVVAEAERRGLTVLKYGGHPFVDIYATRRDKGDAVRLLKAFLGVSHVVYMGDSENDIPAWKAADIKIVVRHRYNAHLSAEGAIPIPQEELPNYLRQVANNIKTAL